MMLFPGKATSTRTYSMDLRERGLRRVKAKTFDTLSDAIAAALRAVKPDECWNDFISRGYGDSGYKVL